MNTTFLTAGTTTPPRVGSPRDRAAFGGTETGTKGKPKFLHGGWRAGKA